MKQYNRIMLGEHGKHVADCLANNYIGAAYLKATPLDDAPLGDEKIWRQHVAKAYLEENPDKSLQAARTAAGVMWTICHGLKKGDIVLAPNGNGGYQVGTIEGDYYFQKNTELPHRRQVNWMSIVIPRKDMSLPFQHSAGSIGTCCNVSKYSQEIETHLHGATNTAPQTFSQPKQNYLESSLHRLLADFLLNSRDIHSITINHTTSKKTETAQKWLHPDMIGVSFQEFKDATTTRLQKSTEIKQHFSLYSFEIKRSIVNDYELKKSFFQALANSYWANYGYLVAFEISDTIKEEMERLNRAFGIGIIQLEADTNNSVILYHARRNELDYYTIDNLCHSNPGYKDFIDKTLDIINAKDDKTCELYKKNLNESCEQGFNSDCEREQYCASHHIPF